MPRRIKIDGVIHTFPDDASDDEIAAALGGSKTAASDGDLLSPAAAVGGARIALPIVKRVAEEVATNPYVSQIGSTAGRMAGGTAGLKTGGYIGMETGKALGAAVGRGAANLTQRGAGAVANALEKAAPYAQSLSTLSGAQGVLDLAQMAEPNRRDIGVLGASIGEPRSDAEKAAHPALINMLLQKLLALGQ